MDKETIYTCYVTASDRKLLGIVTVKDLLLAEDDDDKIEELMITNLICVTTQTDQEEVARMFSKYNFLALPVVDGEHRMVGIVTFDDAMDVMEEEATEDMEIMAAMTPSEKTYLKSSPFDLYKHRIPWLMLLMVSATFTGMIISSFESALALLPALTAFIPMLMGYGCNVPAVMATRTIENPKSRMITMLVTPMISCSARIPVYVVFAGAFFPQNASTVMLCLYMFGTGMALFVAWVFSKIFMRQYESHFVMELPPYRLPSSRGVCRHTWEKGRQYLRKMGGIILVASIVIWALGHFPTGNGELTEAEQQEQSYMGRIGHAIEPAIRPLGYDWRMGVGIIAGVGAKELMVSTLGVLYNCAAEDAEPETTEDASQTRLAQILSQHTAPEAALSYMVFALLYFPCLATIAAVKGESGTWKWAIFTAAYTTVLAYVTAFAVYRMALFF